MTQSGIEQGLPDVAFTGLPLPREPEPRADGGGAEPPSVSRRSAWAALAYPRHYVWVLGLALLDVLVTSMVLITGGKELNVIARFAIEHAGVGGMIAIKGSTLAVIIGICEYLGHRRPVLGQRIAEFALAANSAAVTCGMVYLAEFTLEVLRWV